MLPHFASGINLFPFLWGSRDCLLRFYIFYVHCSLSSYISLASWSTTVIASGLSYVLRILRNFDTLHLKSEITNLKLLIGLGSSLLSLDVYCTVARSAYRTYRTMKISIIVIKWLPSRSPPTASSVNCAISIIRTHGWLYSC